MLVEQERKEEAVIVLKQALERFPTHPQLNYFLGGVYERLGQNDEAIKYMAITLDLNKNHVGALNALAYLYAEENKFLDQAEKNGSKSSFFTA